MLGFYRHGFTLATGTTGTGIGQPLASTGVVDAWALVERWAGVVDHLSRAHLRTLQRRVQQWRGIMADKLVYAASGATLPDPGGIPEMALVTGGPKCRVFGNISQ